MSMRQKCDKLRMELERISDMPEGLFDALYEYRKWWDMQGIMSESEDGWPKLFCFDRANINKFAKYWTGEGQNETNHRRD